MQQQLKASLLAFIQDELEASSYRSPEEPFSEHSIESFQVLEIVLELERQLGKKLSLQGITAESLASLHGLLNYAGEVHRES